MQAKKNALVLSSEYNKILSDLKGTGLEQIINASELYQIKCAECHQFDKKLVGPPHFEVLRKYDGKVYQLIS
jgi:cytochrome c551/c552